MMRANSRFMVAVCALIVGFSLSAQASYTAANVKGSYSFLLDKWTTITGDNSGVLGLLTFNGVSAVSGEFVELTSAGVQTRTLETDSTYTVKSTGAGSMKLVTTEGTLTLDFVLTSVSDDVARQLQLLETSPSADNYAITGSAIAIGLSKSASAANLKGTYSFLANFWIADATSQEALVGTATFDGVSKVTLSYTRESDAAATPVTVIGTYSVDSNGSGSIALPKTNGDFKIAVVFVLNSVVDSIATGGQFLSGKTGVITGTIVLQ
jgi:hypothetical protein